MAENSITTSSSYIQTVPNQRVITVKKAPADKEHLYSPFNLQAMEKACNTLQSKAGIKLWLYLGKNRNGFPLALSRDDFMRFSGCAETAYKSAVKELIEAGYLKHDSGNKYTFYEAGGNYLVADKPRMKQEAPAEDDGKFHF